MTNGFKFQSEDYDAEYFHSHCGLPYERSEPWLQFNNEIAKQVVRQFSPRTAIDAGCAIGMLVEALRNYGVDADGFDISEYALSQVPDYLAPYIKLDTVLNPDAAAKHYDVAICIEVLEHLSEADADIAISNLCRWADTVLFSSTPEDFSEPTHINVQEPGYWIEKFARYGLFYNPALDASYVSKWAMVFQRRTPSLPQLLCSYGNHLWMQRRELLGNRELLEQAQQQNTLLTAQYERIKQKLSTFENEAKEKRIQLFAAYEAQLNELRTQIEQLTSALNESQAQLADAHQANKRKLLEHNAALKRQQVDYEVKSSHAINEYEISLDARALIEQRWDKPQNTQAQTAVSQRPSYWASLRELMFPRWSRRERMYMLTRTSLAITFNQGPIALTHRLYRWLRGERRYFPSMTQNGIKTSSPSQLLPPSHQFPATDCFTVLYIVPMPEISSKRYRVFNVQEQLGKHNIKTYYLNEQQFLSQPEQALRCDVVVLFRVVYHRQMEWFLTEARKQGIKVVFEIDDLVFDPSIIHHIDSPSAMSSIERNTYLDGIRGYREMLLRCDYFIGSTDHIANAAQLLGRKTFIIRNGLNERQLELAASALKRKKADSVIRIGYLSGTPTHRKDFSLITGALARILSEFSEVRLVIQGFLDLPAELLPFSTQIEQRPYVHWEQLVEDTARLDINLAPLSINHFTMGKSALKYFEAAIVEVPTIASSIEDFQVAIRHGETGFLVNHPEDWYRYLRLLIADAELRQQLGKNARQDVLERYTPAALSTHTFQIYQQILFGDKPDGAVQPETQKSHPLQMDQELTPERITDNGRRVYEESADVIFRAHLSLYRYARRFVKGKRVLDAGCGTGYGAYEFTQEGARSVDAIDVDANIVRYASRKYQHPNLHFRADDLSTIPFPENSLDFVFASNVLQQLRDVDTFLNSLLPALAPDGMMFIAVPHISSAAVLELNLDNPHQVNNLHPLQWISKLERYFGKVECLRHWLKAGVEPDWSPSSKIEVSDFVISPIGVNELINRGDTVSLVLVARNPRSQSLPVTMEITGYPDDWNPMVVQASLERMQQVKTTFLTGK